MTNKTKIEKKIADAKKLLSDIGMPKQQQNDMSAYVLLALANISPDSDWKNSTREWLGIKAIRGFLKENYQKEYADNTRESIRKNVLHQLRDAAIIEDSGSDTNSPRYSYKLTKEALKVIKVFNTIQYKSALSDFTKKHSQLIQIYANKRETLKMPVKINSSDYSFSPGPHNVLQKAILEEFAPRFAPNSECLYVGDTTNKDMVKNIDKLSKLGFEITLHDKMPDVVLYREDKNWLYFIEAVTSTGPMSPKRILEIKKMTEKVTAGSVFVTAFLDFSTYKKFSSNLAWETEVWLSEDPNHMIHLNGDRFLGPRD